MCIRVIGTTGWALALALCGLSGVSWSQTSEPQTSEPPTAESPTTELQKVAWVGVKVLPKENYAVKSENEVVDSYDKPVLRLPWIVQDVNGPWLLVGGSRKGWVLRSEVVTLDQAHAYYTGLIAKDPENYWAYNLRGLYWKEEGDFDLAIADYNAVLQLDPSAVAYDNRGNAWQAMGEFDKAIADYTKAIHLNPKYVLSYVGRGLAWQSKNEDEKAIEDYNHALRLNPRYARAYKDRGLVWEVRKDFEQAMSDFKQALEIDPNYAAAYREMAWVWATCADSHWRDGKRAVEYATKACELSGWTNPGYLDVLACAYAEEHDFNSAVKYERQAINLNSDNAEFVAAVKKHLDLFEQNKPYRE